MTINNLVEKIRIVEENLREEQTINEDVSELNEFNSTFMNPSVGFLCENFDFNAKKNGALQTHITGKHNGIRENWGENETHFEPDIVVFDSVVINACDLTFENKIDLEKHHCSNHEENRNC